ncbi:MAG: MFS transporter, partial [Clostridia bacterium]|nr:MFS transporter [Clostridia bacterium]
IISSLLSDRLTARFGAGKVTAFSVLMTAVSMLGFSVSGNFYLLCLFAVPYGLGAGGVDAALNNYVALHYSSRHMSWLHCFWGVGVTISPYIMSFCLTHNFGWQNGYFSVFVIQIILTFVIFISLPLWKNRAESKNETGEKVQPIGLKNSFKIKGVPFVLLTFFGYCALETTAGLWASSYFVEYRSVLPATAASFASLYYIGITVGRFLNGFIADKFGDKIMVRVGILTCTLGVVLVALPMQTNAVSLVGLLIVGLGCAPIYPCIIHSTPTNFGEKNSQAIIGIQMASAYLGSTLAPPIFGFIAENTTLGIYPYYLLVFSLLMLFMSEKLNKVMKKAS